MVRSHLRFALRSKRRRLSPDDLLYRFEAFHPNERRLETKETKSHQPRLERQTEKTRKHFECGIKYEQNGCLFIRSLSILPFTRARILSTHSLHR